MRYLFGEFELLPARYELRHAGAEVAIEPRVLEMLVYLIAHRNRTVEKTELLDEVWHGDFVGESVLTRTVGELRKVLDDSSREPQFIRTVYGRGYVFVADVTEVDDAAVPGLSKAAHSVAEPETARSERRLGLGGSLVLGLCLAVLIWLASVVGRRSPAENGVGVERKTDEAATVVQQAAVAVLPLRNLTTDETLDYLRVAIPNEIVTLLERAPMLSVRPFTATLAYVDLPIEPQDAGHELGATYVIGGQYLVARNELRLTLEAIDARRNIVVWRETVAAPPDEEIALMTGLSEKVIENLLPLLGTTAAISASPTRPSHPLAYSLYLQSLAMDRESAENRQAIAMLETSLELGPGHAPVWAELSRRLMLENSYAGADLAERHRALDALKRALELDPELVSAVVSAVLLRTESGDLKGAFDLVQPLVQRRPDSAEAHFARGYVYRYAGLLELSAVECEMALALDPTNPLWRSCALTMGYLGRFERAADFVALEKGGIWTAVAYGYLALMQGDLESARQHLAEVPDSFRFWRLRGDLVALCPQDNRDLRNRAALAVESLAEQRIDVEDRFTMAQILAACELHEESLPLLNSAVESGFCAGPGLAGPAFAGLAGNPEFQEVVGNAEDCSDAFSTYRDNWTAAGS